MDAHKLTTLSALHPRASTTAAQQYRLKLAQKLAQLGYQPLAASGGGSMGSSDSHHAHLQMKQEQQPAPQ
jgi:hypothetical protein